MMALARKIVSGEEAEAETVGDAFAGAREAEAAAEEYLVDEGWKPVVVEPEAVAVNGNGNGRHDPFGIGPTVELVLDNGHVPAPANGNGSNGNRKGAEAPQQSLFSWAEFMAEPVKPKRRRRKLQPATISMFEWAMELEKEKETVGAGR